MGLLIYNITIFTNDETNRILTDSAIAIEGNRIKEVGREAELKEKYAQFQSIDGAGRLLMPGWINVHMHFYSTFARGLALSRKPHNFAEILQFLWWRLDRSLDLEAVYYSTLIPAITAIKHGVTAFIDHHASPFAVDGSLDRVEAALHQVGLRGILCYEVSDRDGAEIARQGLRENERFIQECQHARKQNPEYAFNGMIGLHASFTLGEESLEAAAELSERFQRGCHIHLLEDDVDRAETQRKYGYQSVVQRLIAKGILKSNSLAAHGIHLSEAEKDQFATSGAFLSHQPQSNMNNAVGRTDISGFLTREVTVGIGTDGMTPDVKADVRAASLIHKHDLHDPNFGWAEIQKMALKNNPAIYSRISGERIGQIVPGYLADLILVDYFPPTALTSENVWGHVLFGIIDAPVDTVIVNGKVVMKNKIIEHIDEEKIAHDARQVSERVWKKFYDLK